jgi:putative acetyltransferase
MRSSAERPDVRIRTERAGDAPGIRAVNLAAFETPAEADLVEALRTHAEPLVSLVAETQSAIVGHILFSPVTLSADPALRLMGLAPMAVEPSWQRRGIGAALILEGIEQCRRLAVDAIVVLGHPGYYPRFGFVPASRFHIRSEYDVPDDVFMIQELREGALAGKSGIARYHDAFASL